MVYATKERIVASRHFSSERYIRSTHPVLYLSGRRDFQGTNTFLSDDAYGRLATLTGALWRPQGYYFDGTDDRLDLGDVTFFDVLTQAMTWIMWIKPTNFGSPGNQMLMDKYDGAGTKGWSILGEGTTRRPLLAIITGSVGPPNYQIQVASDANISDAVWTCVAITYSGSGAASGIKHYQNGLEGTVTIVQDGSPANDISNAITLQVGARQNTLNFVGAIGATLIYNRLFTASEIQQIYLSTRWRYQ